MTFRGVLTIVSLLILTGAIAAGAFERNSQPLCRSAPGDASWPSKAQWDAFNSSIAGRLIATVPIAAPCHRSLFNNSSLSQYDQAKCDALRNNWFFPETHLPSPSSPMAYQFSNNTCNPWSESDTPCTIGYHVAYSVNASTAQHFQKTIAFAKKNNIRLVIRNTGHDYLGKSTGAHGLAIWTHYMKSQELIKKYHGPRYTGPAIKVGAGVEAIEAYRFANANKLVVVGGNCPTVGIAGGFTQGGGHGPLISKYGMSADQVLEWQVVTGMGELVTASSSKNQDLFWALRGGGGGTYGVVVSMTIKAFPDTYFSTAYLTALNDGTNTDALYKGIGKFLTVLPSLVDAGAFVVWVAAPFGFMLMPAVAPDMHQKELDKLLEPARAGFDQFGIKYEYRSFEKPTFLSTYNAFTSSWNVSDYNLGARLIPRSLVEDNPDALLDAVRFVSSKTLISGVTFNLQDALSPSDQVSVNPYFRKAIMGLNLGTPVNYTDWTAQKKAQDEITNLFLPKLEALTPNGAAYLNEADFQAPDWKTLFYGPNYDKLNKIKAKYDRLDLFYARTAVGSDRWVQRADGRLCRA